MIKYVKLINTKKELLLLQSMKCKMRSTYNNLPCNTKLMGIVQRSKKLKVLGILVLFQSRD